jgi:hypothetical protein
VKTVRTPGPGQQRLHALLEGLKTDKVGKVGFFPSAAYEDGTPVAYVAAIQEFGYPEGHIPPRPFMRPTMEAQQGEWKGVARQGAKAVLAGNATGDDVLEAIGLKAAGDIRKTISTISGPSLAESTILGRLYRLAGNKGRGSVTLSLTKPLVASGILLGSVTHAVEAPGE